VKLKITRHAVSYKMEPHSTELERNSSFRILYIFESFTVRFS